MNTLDDLISSSSRTSGATPDGLARGRVALDAAIAAHPRRVAPGSRSARAYWSGGLRKQAVIIGAAGVAAAAVAATVIAIPSSPAHPTGTKLAGSSARPTLKTAAKPETARRTPTTTVTYSITAAKADLTAAYVFAQAAKGAKGAKAAQYAPDGSVPLVSGWPRARYWHTVEHELGLSRSGQHQPNPGWLGPAP